jgi:penicillin-binding protein 2
MEQVVDVGTGTAARLAGIAVAGKTSTAQNPHGDDHAWFMCYAPASSPEVAIALILENAGHGGVEAAPLVGRWLRDYFAWRARLGGNV